MLPRLPLGEQVFLRRTLLLRLGLCVFGHVAIADHAEDHLGAADVQVEGGVAEEAVGERGKADPRGTGDQGEAVAGTRR